MSDHIPDPGQHRRLFYGESANRVRGRMPATRARPDPDGGRPVAQAAPGWARLIAKVYEVDPLVCTRCGQRMSIVAFVTDTLRHPVHPRPPRPQPAAAGEAPAHPGGAPRCRARRGLGRTSRMGVSRASTADQPMHMAGTRAPSHRASGVFRLRPRPGCGTTADALRAIIACRYRAVLGRSAGRSEGTRECA
jgi:hypothetical protein